MFNLKSQVFCYNNTIKNIKQKKRQHILGNCPTFGRKKWSLCLSVSKILNKTFSKICCKSRTRPLWPISKLITPLGRMEKSFIKPGRGTSILQSWDFKKGNANISLRLKSFLSSFTKMHIYLYFYFRNSKILEKNTPVTQKYIMPLLIYFYFYQSFLSLLFIVFKIVRKIQLYIWLDIIA